MRSIAAAAIVGRADAVGCTVAAGPFVPCDRRRVHLEMYAGVGPEADAAARDLPCTLTRWNDAAARSA